MPLVRPYSRLADYYDGALGRSWFFHLRRVFAAIVRRYGVGFRTAADIGCGTGLFACHLARRWRALVFALDRSPEMLVAARRQCCGHSVRFLRQDARCLQLPFPVDLITANFDTINHIVSPAEVRAVFDRVYCNLRPGGHFLFDVVTHQQPLPPARDLVRCVRGHRPRVLQIIRWLPRLRLLRMQVLHFWPGSRAFVEKHWERAYSPLEIAAWLRESGFFIRAALDAHSLRLAARSSTRVFFLAQRRDAP